MSDTNKAQAKQILIGYGICTAVAIFFIYSPFSIPCILKLITGIQSPGCGLSRSFALAIQLDIIGAVTMNILFLPLTMGMAAYFFGAWLDLFTDKKAINRLNAFFAQKWVIVLAILLTLVSWYYNIIRGI